MHAAGFAIDLDYGQVSARGICRTGWRKIAPRGQTFDGYAVGRVGRFMLNQYRLLFDEAGQLAQRDCPRRDALHLYPAILYYKVGWGSFQYLGRHLQGFLASGFSGQQYGGACYLRDAAAEGAETISR